MSKLPVGWITVPIDALTVDCDQRIPAETEVFKYIDIGSVNRITKSIEAPQTLIGKDAPSRARKNVRAGDVLVSMTRPNLNAVALVPDDLDGQIASTGFDVLRVYGIDSRWVFNLVRTTAFVDAMSDLVQGALYPAVRSKDIRSFEIPLAPLDEQKRIVDKLDAVLAKVDACRDRLDRIPSIIKRFRHSILAAAISGKLTEEWRRAREGTTNDFCSVEVKEPYSHLILAPNSWKKCVLGDVVDFIGGSQPPKSTFSVKDGPDVIRLIQIRDYKSDKHLTYIPRNLAKRFCSKTDVMIGRYGPPIFQILRGLEGAYNVALMKAEPKTPDLDLEYLFYFLKVDVLLKFVEAGSDRTAGQDGVRKELLFPYPIFLPSMEEQHEIVRRVESLFAYADRLEARYNAVCAQVEKLTPALLAKAFRGELVPQDPNDEPASVLLARIAAVKPIQTQKKSTRKQS